MKTDFLKKTLIASILAISYNMVTINTASAQVLDSLNNLVGGVSSLAVKVAGLMMTVAFIAFLGTIINFLVKRAKGEEKGLQQAKSMLGWSVIAIFVMMAIWGITAFISQNTGIAVGGCIGSPSAIPGQPAPAGCGNAATSDGGSSGGGKKPAGASCLTPSECLSGDCYKGLGSNAYTCK